MKLKRTIKKYDKICLRSLENYSSQRKVVILRKIVYLQSINLSPFFIPTIPNY